MRVEDAELLRGEGRYVDDLAAASARAVFVRSTEAHARLRDVDLVAARSAPGVLGAFVAGDLGLRRLRGHGALPPVFDRPCLAEDVIRFVGEPVAVVIAATTALATDAAELVIVDTEPLDPVVDPERALAEHSPLLFPDHATNLAFAVRHGCTGDPLQGAEHTVRSRFVNQRVASAPMEPDGAFAVPRQAGEPGLALVTVYASTQRVHQARDAIAASLQLDPEQVRVVAPCVGGGFGGKFECSPEAVVVAAAALRLFVPVGWTQTRTENLLCMPHGRGQVQNAALGLRHDGTFVGLDVSVVADAGGYPMVGAVIPNATAVMAPGPYRFAKVRAQGRAAATNTTPVGAYRGAGRPEATAMIERLIDLAGAELGLDPIEIRRRNLRTPDELSTPTPTGLTYDSGDYRRCLDAALAAAGYEEVRAEQRNRRTRGDRCELGIGVGMWLDCTPMNRPGEYASVAVRHGAGGVVEVFVRDGANDQGQGHATTWGLLLAEVLGIAYDSVRLAPGDTAEVPTGEGTGSARSLMLAGGAVHQAAGVVLEQAREVAAHLLEASPADVVITGEGSFTVVGSPVHRVSWRAVVDAVEAGRLPDEVSRKLDPDGRLGASVDFEQPGPTFPSGCHVAVVDVDTETGLVRLERFVAVDDCGRVVNPVVVAGQQHGGIVQGVAQALYEQVVHDGLGMPLTTTIVDYGIPSAAEVPALEVATAPTESTVNPLGTKGIGQSGAIGSTVAVQNAVIDALGARGVRHIDMPLTPERVWRALREPAPQTNDR